MPFDLDAALLAAPGKAADPRSHDECSDDGDCPSTEMHHSGPGEVLSTILF